MVTHSSRSFQLTLLLPDGHPQFLKFSVNSFANSVGLVEVAHYESPHQDLHCLQIQLFSSLVVKELNDI